MKLTVHMASSCVSRMRGLSGITRLNESDGLLMRFPFPFFWPIWMRDMRFPLDVVWLRRGRVVDMCKNLSPDNPWQMHFPRYCADACLELPAGEAKRRHLTIGTPIDFQILDLEI